MLGTGNRAKSVPRLSCELRNTNHRPTCHGKYRLVTDKGHRGRGEEHQGCVGRANIVKGEAEVRKAGYKSSGSLVLLLMEELPGITFIAGC